ncbi:protealysin inhibitor emfourin [Paracoccus nototheniae]|uniref:Protealysin inhibitor emfourin n=1 Tax=Paracoccus nototheniae TaxID=2489002 RepID=A0ABW4E0Z7_9RHOB|nr:protealysin inhibitor emfourin [Paracoccus nototheniae]
MIIEIRTHGGFGGIAAPAPRRIDTGALPEPLRGKICAAFRLGSLTRLADVPCPACPDRMRYAITVTEDASPPHSVTLSEGQLPPDMLDLIDSL